MTVRVRFAPSPTGYLHVGGARTALFNWLFARHSGGTFVLRIEDTDVERSSDDMVTGILDSMRWLGLDWDEGPGVGGPYGPYFQSERLARYRDLAERLVKSGAAYYCYCDPADLKARREAARARGESWDYDGTCRRLPAEEIVRREAAGRSRAVRFAVPEGRTTVADLVQGDIDFDHANIEDFVVFRSDGNPTYHLSVVADDVEMQISHVIRGADHISNTPKQILLYRALGAECPRFAHVPLILGPDRRRLSKRHGATAVGEYERNGYLPEAFTNFLALLGWSPGDDRERFTLDELVHAFSLEGINLANAVFNQDKLDWFNAEYLARLSLDELIRRVAPHFEAAGLWDDSLAAGRQGWFGRVLELLRPRCRRLTEFAEAARYFFEAPVTYDEAAASKHFSVPGMPEHLDALAARFDALGDFTTAGIETALREVAKAAGLKPATLIHGTRLAATGRSAGPGLFDILALLDRADAATRLRRAASAIGTRPGSAG